MKKLEQITGLKRKLSTLQYRVTQENETEPPFTGEYWNFFKKGNYHCIVCSTKLFESKEKFVSSCGWASFSFAEKKKLDFIKDETLGMIRTEVRCAKCKAHLGHVFNDGPAPTGLRYCINSASILFKK